MIIAAILAGGKGLRLGGDVPKQLLMLGEKPVIKWSVDTFHMHDKIDEIIIVSESSSLDSIKKIFNPDNYGKITAIIEGGKERVDSSANAVFLKDYNPEDIFLIHDAARPFISISVIDDLIEEIEKNDAAGVYIPATDTIAVSRNNIVDYIPERNAMFYAQTPQGFKYHVITEAHNNYKINRIRGITDDVSLARSAGYNVSIVKGSDLNFKITTEQDYRIACLMVENKLV